MTDNHKSSIRRDDEGDANDYQSSYRATPDHGVGTFSALPPFALFQNFLALASTATGNEMKQVASAFLFFGLDMHRCFATGFCFSVDSLRAASCVRVFLGV